MQTKKASLAILQHTPRQTGVSPASIRLAVFVCGDLGVYIFNMQTKKTQLAAPQLTPPQIKLSYQPPVNPIKINNPLAAEQFFLSVWDKELMHLQEQFYVAFVNANYEVICWRCINTGTICNTSVDVKLIFSLALSCFARAIVVAHNHPSGNIYPSRKDIALTKQIAEGATILGLELADHLIMGNGFFSFKQEAML